MLHTYKVMQQLTQDIGKFFVHTAQEKEYALLVWQKLVNNPELMEQLRTIKNEWYIPVWQGAFSQTNLLSVDISSYTCVAVDGSQIYPDKHQGISCYVLNIGTVEISYIPGPSSIRFNSIPSVHFIDPLLNQQQDHISVDIVNCRRTELEFAKGLELMSELPPHTPEHPAVFLCDGSLIFWHLESKDEQTKAYFMRQYIRSFLQFHQSRLLIAGYISLPKAKDIVHILQHAIQQGYVADTIFSDYVFSSIVDADIFAEILPPWSYSQVFESTSPIVQEYPLSIRPCFVYLNVIDEIVRIEFPKWITEDTGLLHKVMGVIMDQCKKGQGYPVALAEAHEQAVIKNAEREQFFQLLHTMSRSYGNVMLRSQKLQKKRIAGI